MEIEISFMYGRLKKKKKKRNRRDIYNQQLESDIKDHSFTFIDCIHFSMNGL